MSLWKCHEHGGDVVEHNRPLARTGAYTAVGGRDQRWKPPAGYLVAALLALEAVLAAGFAAFPPDPRNEAGDAVMAGLLALAAVVCAARWRHRGPLWLLETYLVIAWGVPMVFIATRGVEASQLLWAAVAVLVAVIAAFYLPPRNAGYQVVLIIVVYLVAALAFDPPTRPLFAAGFVSLTALATAGVAWVRADRDRLFEAIASMATTDPLTGLLNRRGLDEEAGIVHANATRAGRSTVVALLDLDGLKKLNDTQGHEAGDGFITGVAAHWRATVRQGDLIARIGGDEFVIVLPQADEATAGDLLTRIRDSAPGPWSHGWTIWAPDESLEAALERADALMHADKTDRKAGRDEPVDV